MKPIVQLHCVHYGEKSPLKPTVLILPGLLGSARNWSLVAKALGQTHPVLAVDLRGHGKSPHSSDISFTLMCEDVLALMDREDLDSAVILGHSMGGKVAMTLATTHPKRIKALIVVDIAPKPYTVHSRSEFEGMNSLRLSDYKSRAEITTALRPWVRDEEMLQFLLTNLVHDRETDQFHWQMDLPLLTYALSHFSANPIAENARYNGPTLVIWGGKSSFIDPDSDQERFKRHFPQIQWVRFPESGHNPHVNARERFVREVEQFLTRLEKID